VLKDDFEAILKDISFQDYQFEVIAKGSALLLRAFYVEVDIASGQPSTQYTRKWTLSKHMTKSEFVQTAFKCVLTSAEHRTREHFKYRGKRVFSPHFDVDALWEICNDKRFDYRK
jgi:hypothetical protein